MNDDFDLIAELREDQGKGASRRLRHEGKVPAIIYGAGRPPRALAFDHNRVVQQLENESFYSSVLNIKVRDRSQAAILKDVQRHPSKPQIMHLDFQRIVEDEEIKMLIPIHFLGEDVAPGVKDDGGKVQHHMTEVEVVCLPKHLPEYLDLDVSGLGLDEMLKISDIPLPEGVSVPALAQDDEAADRAVVSIHVIREEIIEDELEGEETTAEVPVVGEEADEGDDAADASDDDTD